MHALIPFPDISPEIFTITIGSFSFALRWYALAYIAGIIAGWRLAVRLFRAAHLWPGNTPPMPPERAEDALTAIILGIILGGRLGFVLFYQPAYYLANPLEILKVWEGGMSFHGGFLGVVLAGFWIVRHIGAPVLSMGDTLALCVPPGLFFGRIANFINAELWGRPTTLSWGVAFPGQAAQDCAGAGVIGLCARHPSQLYEAALEGLVLGGLLLWLAWRRGALRRPGLCMGVFLAGYATARFAVEFVRQPDAQFITAANPLGHALHLAGGAGLTMGQVLSVPMLVMGLWLIWRAASRDRVIP